MATKLTIECPRCGKARRGNQTLFRTLLRAADEPPATCDVHHCPTRIHLKFDFGLDAADSDTVVEGVFRPRRPERWRRKEGGKVTFYPFLVVLKRSATGRRATWLPYWHIVEKNGRKRPLEKYGQWAPFMSGYLFDNLLTQARAAGLIN